MLLLANLPPGPAPRSVLDLGCGWGALGLPVAAAYPQATVWMVDRDTVAADVSAANARANQLGNVRALPGLGCSDLPPALRVDWALCNVPARIGPRGVAALLGSAAARLGPGGALRAVVIHDLWPGVQQAAARHQWPLTCVAKGPRHTVLGLPPLPADPAWEDPLETYGRDRVTLPVPGGDGLMSLQRPHDINQDPSHLTDGLPLLLEMMPRSPDATLVFRGTYGAVAVAAALGGAATVLNVERDLLHQGFAHINAHAHGVGVETVAGWRLEDHAAAGAWALCVMQAPPPGSPRTLVEELRAVAGLLSEHGQVRVGGPMRALEALPPVGAVLARRGSWAVWQASRRGLARLNPTPAVDRQHGQPRKLQT